MLICPNTEIVNSSFVVDELNELYAGSNTGISYYYCDYRTRDTEPLILAMRSILRLLTEKLDLFPESLQRLFETSTRKGGFALVSELEIIIHELCSTFSHCFVLVDAMDEFSIENPSQKNQFVKLLDSLAELGAKVLVTSRTSPSTMLSVDHAVEKYSANEADIRAYITETLHKDDSMSELLNSKLETDIGNAITNQANGT
jgi:6-pyruvoyl-tetrahydropterin synthase